MDGEHFSKKVRERLGNNRYVTKISPRQISFTDGFRAMLVHEIEEAMAEGDCDINVVIKQTILSIGIDPELFDSSRIASIRSTIRGMITRPPVRMEASEEGAADAKRLERLEGTVLYMQQEMEYIKKTLSKRDTR